MDRLTLTFPVAAVDFSLDQAGSSPWVDSNDTLEEQERDQDEFDRDFWRDQMEEDQEEGDEDDGPPASRTTRAWEDSLSRVRTGGWRTLRVGRASVHVAVYERHDHDLHRASPSRPPDGASSPVSSGAFGWQATVSFNPARLYDPEGWAMCPGDVADVWGCALIIYLARVGVVTPSCPHVDEHAANALDGAPHREEWPARTGSGRADPHRTASWCQDVECLSSLLKVSRVDVGVDIQGVTEPKLWVDAFMGHRQRHSKASKRRYGPVSASARAGAKGPRFVIYDKAVEATNRRRPRSARPPNGTLRLEVQARSAKLNKRMLTGEVEQVADEHGQRSERAVTSRALRYLTPEFLDELFLESFKWSGLDRWIGGQHPIRTRPSSLTPVTATRLIEFIDGTTRKYEELTTRYGYILGVPRSEVSGPLRHLDVQTRTERKPDLDWRTKQGLIGDERGAAATVLRRRSKRNVVDAPGGGAAGRGDNRALSR